MACKEVDGNVKRGERKIVCNQVKKSENFVLCSNHDYGVATFCFSTRRQY